MFVESFAVLSIDKVPCTLIPSLEANQIATYLTGTLVLANDERQKKLYSDPSRLLLKN